MAVPNPENTPPDRALPIRPPSCTPSVHREDLPDLAAFSSEEAEFYSQIVDCLTSLAHFRNTSYTVPAATKAVLEHYGLAEWGAFGDSLAGVGCIPYFEGDAGKHQSIHRLVFELAVIGRAIAGKEFQEPGDELLLKGAVSGLSTEKAFEKKSHELERKRNALIGFHDKHDVSTDRGIACVTDFGRWVLKQVDKFPAPVNDLILRIIIKAQDAIAGDDVTFYLRSQRQVIFRHATMLASLDNPTRHLRKMLFALVEGTFDAHPSAIHQRMQIVEADVMVDRFYSDRGARERKEALDYLQKREGGNYCPPPYPSWQNERRLVAERQSQKVVQRGRGEAYNFTRLAVEARHLPDRSESLLGRFGRDCFENLTGVAGARDIPPGAGFVFSTPRLEKLYFAKPGSSDTRLNAYENNESDWSAPALKYFENSTFVMLRGAKIVINNNPFFKFDGQKYVYVVFNDHMSGSYGGAYCFPSSVVMPKLRDSLYDLDYGRNPEAVDITSAGFTAAQLWSESIRQGKPPMNLAWMSTLFGTCCNALPVGWAPHLSWENPRQDQIWKDIHNHVHASFLVWGFRGSQERVDRALAPLQRLHEQVESLAIGYQRLLDIFMRRYGAWKNDQTPGPKAAPRMLVEAYRWHHLARKAGSNTDVLLCLADKRSLNATPVPILDCRTLSLLGPDGPIQLPRHSDGTENGELSLWRKYVRPHLVDPDVPEREGHYALTFMKEADL